MSNFSSLIAHGGSNCTDVEWDEYVRMGNVRDNETPSSEFGLAYIPTLGTYAPAIGLAICFSCDQLIYTGKQTANIGNYNYIGMERHWKFSCSGNKYCGVNYDEYLKIKQKSNSAYSGASVSTSDAHGGSNCTDVEWDEYVRMGNVRDNETPSSEFGLAYIPTLGTYAPAIGLAICFSCDQLIYTGKQTANIGNYNYIGMERHWKFSCSGNKYCGVNYDEYLKIKQKSNSAYSGASVSTSDVSTLNFDDMYALHRYKLWMQNAIRKIECAREVGRKIQACITIQRKFIEWYYRHSGLCASLLAEHYQLLWAVREEMCQINNNRITSRVHNPLSEEQASSIHSDIETLLISEIDKYAKKKNRQRCTKSILDQTEINLKSNLDYPRSNLDHSRSNLDHPRSNLDQIEINLRPNLQVTNSEDEINT
ncbi:hypothetical protein Glove_328g71 [Diversispora epigaea]|uniref:Uncharacterized protein n=1 Tax=Diversispora epigaea TaxID=1348612 RepID=A0A397HP40_9GLOM|nr:hypothetical protein Glove_328g71 [Diversispora epigaea]